MEEKTKNPYSLVKLDSGGKNILKLQYNGMDMLCPFKSRIPIQTGKVSNSMSLMYQECGCICPHFSYQKHNIEDSGRVLLTCGSTREIFVEDPKQKTEFKVV